MLRKQVQTKHSNCRKVLLRDRGFTLMELLVAVSIFAIVVAIASSVYISTVGSQRKAFGRQDILDSSRFALESMSRAIRQSSIVSASEAVLQINHPDKGALEYTLVGGRVMESDAPLTSDNVVIEKLSFLTSGISGSDGIQPRITIVLAARSKNAKQQEQSRITIQTTITPRNLQVQ